MYRQNPIQQSQISQRNASQKLLTPNQQRGNYFPNTQKKVPQNYSNLSPQPSVHDFNNQGLVQQLQMQVVNLQMQLSAKTLELDSFKQSFQKDNQGNFQHDKIHQLIEFTENLCKICVQKNQQIEYLKQLQPQQQQIGNIDVLGLLEQNKEIKYELNTKEDQVMELKLRIKDNEQKLNNWSNYDDIKRQLIELQAKYKEEITTAHNKLFQQEIEIKSLTMKSYCLQQQVTHLEGNADRIKEVESELANWKKKFNEINREYHLIQERLMVALAELDSIKRRYTGVGGGDEFTKVMETLQHKLEIAARDDISERRETYR